MGDDDPGGLSVLAGANLVDGSRTAEVGQCVAEERGATFFMQLLAGEEDCLAVVVLGGVVVHGHAVLSECWR